jgi:hypothetical protein
LPAFLAAPAAELVADLAPETADLAARFVSLALFPALLAAPRAWRVEAAFLPALCARALAWFRFRVAAPFLAAACRSALVWAIGIPPRSLLRRLDTQARSA